MFGIIWRNWGTGRREIEGTSVRVPLTWKPKCIEVSRSWDQLAVIGGGDRRLSLLGYRQSGTSEGWGKERLDHTRGTISPRAKTLPTLTQTALRDTNVAHTTYSVVYPQPTPFKKLYVRTRPNTLLLDRYLWCKNRGSAFSCLHKQATFDALSKYPCGFSITNNDFFYWPPFFQKIYLGIETFS